SASFNSEYNNFIEISVKDTGIGMSEERKNVIFNIDNDTSNKGTEGETGSGLGLTLCAEFVKLNNGEIWVESEEGFGSKFTFTMPLNK
ncbi:MAG: ATP-binding protein, partial [Bacteroidota bacterium]|nr:ATP-binding protein [Bacteroidota bacterium]